MGFLFVLSCIMIGVAWAFGARFDIAIDELRKGKLSRPQPGAAQVIKDTYDHGEL